MVEYYSDKACKWWHKLRQNIASAYTYKRLTNVSQDPVTVSFVVTMANNGLPIILFDGHPRWPDMKLEHDVVSDNSSVAVRTTLRFSGGAMGIRLIKEVLNSVAVPPLPDDMKKIFDDLGPAEVPLGAMSLFTGFTSMTRFLAREQRCSTSVFDGCVIITWKKRNWLRMSETRTPSSIRTSHLDRDVSHATDNRIPRSQIPFRVDDGRQKRGSSSACSQPIS